MPSRESRHRISSAHDWGSTERQVRCQKLIEQLIDSEAEWRQLISEANGGSEALKGLSELQMKRQEVIHELILTERHHCLTLALMRQVYLAGLRKLNETRASSANSALPGEPLGEQIDLERLFPALDDLIQAHELLFAHLRLRLVECCQAEGSQLIGLVGPLGDLLISQFRLSTDNSDNSESKTTVAAGNGQKLLAAYGKFCGQQHDSTRYYKYLMQHDRGFKLFIEVSSSEFRRAERSLMNSSQSSICLLV